MEGQVSLNADQRLAVENKVQVLELIRELEELQAQMEVKERESMKALKKLRRQMEADRQQLVQQVKEEEQAKLQDALSTLTRLFYAQHVLLPQIPLTSIVKTDRDVVQHFVQTVTGLGMDVAVDARSMADLAAQLCLDFAAVELSAAEKNSQLSVLKSVVDAAYAFMYPPQSAESVPAVQAETVPEAVEELVQQVEELAVEEPVAVVSAVVEEPVVETTSVPPTKPLSFMTQSLIDEPAMEILAESVAPVLEEPVVLQQQHAPESTETATTPAQDSKFDSRRPSRGGKSFSRGGRRPSQRPPKEHEDNGEQRPVSNYRRDSRGDDVRRGRGGYRGRGGRGGSAPGSRRPSTQPQQQQQQQQ